MRYWMRRVMFLACIVALLLSCVFWLLSYGHRWFFEYAAQPTQNFYYTLETIVSPGQISLNAWKSRWDIQKARLAQNIRKIGVIHSFAGFEFRREVSPFVGGLVWYTGFRFAVPFWFLAAILATVTFLIRPRRHPLPGACSNCGYDLRATPDRCPECGHAVTSPAPA